MTYSKLCCYCSGEGHLCSQQPLIAKLSIVDVTIILDAHHPLSSFRISITIGECVISEQRQEFNKDENTN